MVRTRMESAYKFLQKLWLLHQKILNNKSDKNASKDDENELKIFTNQIINKITNNLENFHYNVIIANLHEIYRHYKKRLKNQLIERFFY